MKFLRLPEVKNRVGLSRPTIYRKMSAEPPEFPRCYKLSANAVAWLEDEIDAWIQSRIEHAIPAGQKVA